MSKILFLGYGSNSFSKINSVSFLYKKNNTIMLVDCGSTIPFNLHAVVPSFIDITYCYISHSHFDHFLGLPYFIIGRNLDAIAKKKKNPDFIVPDLNIIIEKRLQKVLLDLIEICHSDIKDFTFNINFIDLHDSLTIDASDFILNTKKVNHTVDTYGFSIFENENKLLSYSSDTLYSIDLEKFFQDSKYLIIEGMVPSSEDAFSKKTKHATFNEALKIAEVTNANYTYLVHLQPRYLESIQQIENQLKSNGLRNIGFPNTGEWYVLHI